MSKVHFPISKTGWDLMKNSNKTSAQYFTLITILFLAISLLESSTLVLKNADYNRNSLVNGSLVSVLRGNVTFEYENSTIKADRATWHRKDGNINFIGNINVVMKEQKLTCQKMIFNRDEKKLTATRKVDFYDSKEQIRLLGNSAIYEFDSKFLTLSRSPQLFRYDTTVNETLSISGRILTYDDSLKIAVARDDVIITKGLFTSTCQIAYYHNETGMTRLRKNPEIFYDKNDNLVGDSIDVFFENERIKGVAVMRLVKWIHKDMTQEDTTIREVTGDSLYMAFSDSTIETIWTYTDVNATDYSTKKPDLINQMDGKVMVLKLAEGKPDNLVIAGNAESVYFMDDSNESGKNVASGDSISIDFRDGKAVYIKMTGDVRGVSNW